jgi:hypothetical protein
MVLYARTPGRFLRQLLGDLALLVWVAIWVSAAVAVHGLVTKLAEPGRALESAGEGFTESMGDAASTVGGVPVVGGSLSSAFGGLRSAGTALADAGRSQQSAVGDLALLLAVVIGATPILLALMVWLPWRITWVRRASAADHLVGQGGLELFALRALTTQPVTRLQSLGPDLVRRWEERDPATVARLADMEMSALGLRLPSPAEKDRN